MISELLMCRIDIGWDVKNRKPELGIEKLT